MFYEVDTASHSIPKYSNSIVLGYKTIPGKVGNQLGNLCLNEELHGL